jgi:hypothetical protein
MSPTPAETIDDWERAASILGDAAVDLGAELERVRAELNDAREVLELVEQERDEYRGAITAHKRAIWSEIGRPGSKMDRDLWAVLR